ncbi:hypothetical protein FRB99_003052 [Tulasnella sp. 403]|nr:hypothetical protein FRB99_003052 [Tulasnella sp. 403]
MLPDTHVYASLLGYISIGATVSYALPQLFLHWRQKKTGAISMAMLWIILLIVMSIADGALIWQCFHYDNWRGPRRLLARILRRNVPVSPSRRTIGLHAEPDVPSSQTLDVSEKEDPLPTPDQGHLDDVLMVVDLGDAVPSHPAEQTPQKHSWRHAAAHILLVFLAVGLSVLVWGLTVARVRHTADLKPGENGTDPKPSVEALVFGWVSTILLYIINISGSSSVLVKSLGRNYLISNSAFLAQSFHNLLFDTTIIIQILVYRRSHRNKATPPSTLINEKPPVHERSSITKTPSILENSSIHKLDLYIPTGSMSDLESAFYPSR